MDRIVREKIKKTTLNLKNNLGGKMLLSAPYFNDFLGFFSPNWAPKIYPFSPKNRERACGTDDHLSGGGGGGAGYGTNIFFKDF